MSGITDETSNHLLGSTAWTNNFVGFGSFWNTQSGLLFTFGLIRIDSCFVPSYDVVDQIWPTSVEFLEHFFAPFNTSLFLSFGQIVWDPTITKFPYAQVIMQNRMYCFHINAYGCLNLAICYMPVSHNHFTHSINISGNNRRGWTTFTEFITKKRTSTLEFGKSNLWSLWEPSPAEWHRRWIAPYRGHIFLVVNRDLSGVDVGQCGWR